MNQNDKRKIWFTSNWIRIRFKVTIDDVVIVIVVLHTLYDVVLVCYAFRKKEKSKNDFRCFFFFDCVIINWKKKKSKNNFCWFFFSSNIIIIVVNVVIYYLWVFICVAIDFIMIVINIKKYNYDVETFLKNEDCFIIHFDENLLTELIHNASSSFVLSFDSIFFVMFAFVLFFLVSIVFASSFNASRFCKRVHESFSFALKKKSRLTNDYCDCTLSSKWLEDLKKARCIENIKRIEHFLKELYYLNRQICKKYINQLKQLFELLSIENLVEIKKVLWEFLKFDEEVEIFKIEYSNFFEIFEDDE